MKNQNIFWQVAAMALSGLITGCGGSHESQTLEAWDLRNNPFGFDARVVSSLSNLPLEGKIKVLSWSDTYWPSMRGGVAARWRNWTEDNFKYQPPSREQFLSMSIAEKANLSPAEKYDAFLGRFDYPLVQAERSRTSPDRPGWEGLCHGWSVASLNFAEPKPVLLKSPNGLEIPFGSSDIKGLLTLMQGNFNYPTVDRDWRFIGEVELTSPIVFDGSTAHAVHCAPRPYAVPVHTDWFRITFTIGFDRSMPISNLVSAWPDALN